MEAISLEFGYKHTQKFIRMKKTIPKKTYISRINLFTLTCEQQIEDFLIHELPCRKVITKF